MRFGIFVLEIKNSPLRNKKVLKTNLQSGLSQYHPAFQRWRNHLDQSVCQADNPLLLYLKMSMFVLKSRLLVVTSHSTLNILPVIFKAFAFNLVHKKSQEKWHSELFWSFWCVLEQAWIPFFFFFLRISFLRDLRQWKNLKWSLKTRRKSPKRKFLLADVQVFSPSSDIFGRFFWEIHQVLL